MKTVATVELNLLERMVPLVGGYLEAYAGKDSWLRSSFRFRKYVGSPRTQRSALTKELVALDADVYAFSCYVWNSALVKSIVAEIRRVKPNAWFVLGGPQVMNRAEKYVPVDDSRIIVCNGEGEDTFSDILRELTNERPHLPVVQGISIRADGEMITTPGRNRTVDLDDIPSPFLNELFDADYTMSVLETNRGCPFRCGFCYWGAATNDKIYRFSEERVRDEITWLSKKGIFYLYIADANWGMLGRDVDITRHIAMCSQEYESPRQLYFSSAKNSPERVLEIVKICHSADMLVAQPVSLQTLADDALRMIERRNIKRANYIKLQTQLDALNISSVTELIWPLPGETLQTFKAGIDELCRAGTSVVVVYPHLLLPNSPLEKRRTDYGFETVTLMDDVGESELVVGTKTVTRSQFDEGIRFAYASHLLYNARALRSTAKYINERGYARYEVLFNAFAEFLRDRQNPIMKYIDESCSGQIGIDIFPYGKIIHYAFHEYRVQFRELLRQFVMSLDYASDKHVTALYELDQIRLPYVYASTPMQVIGGTQVIESSVCRERGYDVTIPEWAVTFLTDRGEIVPAHGTASTTRYRVSHALGQCSYMESQGIDHNAGYCLEAVRTGTMVPRCVAVA